MSIFEEDHETITCKNEELLDTIGDCLADIMLNEFETQKATLIPSQLALGYSDQGGMGLVIGKYLIICDDFPPPKEKVIEIIGEAYKIIIQDIGGLPIFIGEIKEIPTSHKMQCELEIEMTSIQ